MGWTGAALAYPRSMNAKDKRLLSNAQAVAVVGGLISLGVLPRGWRKAVAAAAVTLVIVGLLAE